MRHVSLFGLPMHVGSLQELTDVARASRADGSPTYYMVTRCADLPESAIPISVRRRNLRTPCEGCGEICWYDTENYVPFTTVICSVCLAGKQDLDEVRGYVGEAQVREIADNYGRGRRRGRTR